MTVRKQVIFLAPLLIILLACQTINRAIDLESIGRINPTHTNTPIPSKTLLPTKIPSKTSTITSLPATQTQPPDTATPTPTATSLPTKPTPTHLAMALQLEIFEDLWKIVKEEYLYLDYNGLDWEAIYPEFKGRIEAGLSNAEFYIEMDEMIFRLGDDHSVFLSPEMVEDENAEFEGSIDYNGIGVLLSTNIEWKRAVVLVTLPGYPADQAGIKSRDSILTVNGEPILTEEGLLKNSLRGAEGTELTLTVQSPGEEIREITLIRSLIKYSLPVPHKVLISPQGKRIGYLLILSFADSNVDERVAEALEEMARDGNLDGIIIDNTHNRGGSNTVFKPVLSLFATGTMGTFISRNGERALNIFRGKDIGGSQTAPLVILVSENTVSYGEIFSGVLQDIGRAYLIGETTKGNVETLWGYEFEDGSRAWIAHESFRPFNNPEADWEESGIIPDQILVTNWYEYKLEDDPRIQAALNFIDDQQE